MLIFMISFGLAVTDVFAVPTRLETPHGIFTTVYPPNRTITHMKFGETALAIQWRKEKDTRISGRSIPLNQISPSQYDGIVWYCFVDALRQLKANGKHEQAEALTIYCDKIMVQNIKYARQQQRKAKL